MSESIIHLLHTAGQAADAAFAEEMGEADVTPRQCVVLIAIRDAKQPPSQTYLVHRTGIDRSTMADIVRRLVSRKLVTRKRTRKDARLYAVSLTEQGYVVADTAEQAAIATNRTLVRRLPSAVRNSLVESLRTIAEVATPPPRPIVKPLEAAE